MKSLKARLVLIFTAVILILNIGLGLVSIKIVSKNLTTTAHNNLEDRAQQEAEYIQAIRESELKYIDALAQNAIIVDTKIPLDQKIAFFEYEAKRTGYRRFCYSDLKGNSIDLDKEKTKVNISERDYFKEATKGKPAASDLIISKVTNDAIIVFAAPVYVAGQQVGVFYGEREGISFCDIVTKIKFGETGYAYIINDQGVTVANKNKELVLKQDNVIENAKSNKSLEEFSDLAKNKILKREVSSGEYIYDGIKKTVGFAPIEGTPWIMVIGVENSEILKEVNGLQNILILLCIFTIIIGALITYFVSGSIVKPIKKITVAAQRIADGYFDVELSVNSRDEVGQLATAFNLTIKMLENYQGYIDEMADALMHISQGNLNIQLDRDYVGEFKKLKDNMRALLDNFNTTLMEINQSADQVANGSEQVASGSQALSEGATEQASSVEELSATITEITVQIKENAENAKLANDRAVFAGKELTNSNDQMKEMVTAMEQITVKSSEISKIIKIIDDIAFQTNILALNAAVEAARAGVAGKGFAVVADEVRNLAGKSAEAAKSTTSLIDETLQAVENGSGLASKTASSLESSAQVTNDAVTLIDKIALASNEQAASIAQVNQGVEQISAVIQTNAATAEESAAASEELSSQSNLLKSLISNFKLRGSNVSQNEPQLDENDSIQYNEECFTGDSYSNKY